MLTMPVTRSVWGRAVVVCMKQSCVNANQAYDSLRLGQTCSGMDEGELCT